MKKLIVISLITFALGLCFSILSFAQTDGNMAQLSDYLAGVGLSKDASDYIKNLVERRSPPIIRNVTISPQTPAAGEPVTVTATVVVPPNMSGKETSEAYLNFSATGGKTWNRVNMEQDSVDDRIWTGTIPGQPSGASIIFGVQATNAFDETSVEVVCKSKGLPVSNEFADFSTGCDTDAIPELCKAKIPLGCMFPMSISPDKFKLYEEDLANIPDDLNMRGGRIGYDDNYIHVDIPVKGRVTPGQLSPPDIHVYVVAWLNPDRGAAETGFNAILKQGAAIIYAPLNPTGQCAVYYFKTGSTLEIDKASAACDVSDNHMIFSIKRKIIEPNPGKSLEFLSLTFTQRELGQPVVDIEDSSLFTRIRHIDRGYKIP